MFLYDDFCSAVRFDALFLLDATYG